LAKNSTAKQVFAYSSIGLQLAITLLIFVYGGYRLDRRYETEPLFIVAGVVLGMGIGFYNLFKELSGLEKGGEKKGKKDSEKRRKWL
jgi:F0F1-type ATP synthase assembly protein I